MKRQRSVLFLQLPQLDNDTTGPSENLMLAAGYLDYSISRSDESQYYRTVKLEHAFDHADTPTLLRAIAHQKPDVIAATLYLWNIEWTLRLLGQVKALLPSVRIIVGGPEVARRHPFLYRSGVPDMVVTGEGESVFPGILKAVRLGQPTQYTTVAMKTRSGYRWGTIPPPPVTLSEALPPADCMACAPDHNGMAYMETSRGCPMRCTYCRYAHLRPRVSFLNQHQVFTRVKALRQMGAREIRFIDPTFNAHPCFRVILKDLANLNRDHHLRFFAEVMAERLTAEDAQLLADANFTEIEVGMQSRDPEVLRAIRRPAQTARLDKGVRLLSRQGIKVTLDIMYALPRQDLSDVRRSIAWSLRTHGTNVQCLQTLLLPGTELRDRRNRWQCKALTRPPYAVTSTQNLSSDDIKRVETLINRHPRLRSDAPTQRFVGRTLPDLFDEQVALNASDLPAAPIPGSSNRRTYLISGANLFPRHAALARFIRRCIREQPDGLFQFILLPEAEEPLDLLDILIAAIHKAPKHLLDRYASALTANRVASRRLRIRLPPRRRFDARWVAAAESQLSEAFA